MKSWIIQEHGGFGGLRLIEQPEPAPGEREVLIRVHAVSLNYRDLTTLQAERPGNLKPPFVPCSDGAGEVVAVGAGVSRWKIGDRVAGIFFSGWIDGPFELAYHKTALGGSAPGMLSQYVTLSEEAVVAVPEHLSWEEAACLPCAAVTVWQALFRRGALVSGQTVLTLGTGGVSIFALQLATAAGARVLITSSSDAKLERARTLGCVGDDQLPVKSGLGKRSLAAHRQTRRGSRFGIGRTRHTREIDRIRRRRRTDRPHRRAHGIRPGDGKSFSAHRPQRAH